MNHFTNDAAFKAISSQVEWCFTATQPRCNNPFGAYFTTLEANAVNLAVRLRIPVKKLAYVLSFTDVGDLKPLRGDRGEYIFYSPSDYKVPQARQVAKGATGR